MDTLEKQFADMLEDMAAQMQQADEPQGTIDCEAEAMTNDERFAKFVRDMRLV